jgi:hypothetical protein
MEGLAGETENTAVGATPADELKGEESEELLPPPQFANISASSVATTIEESLLIGIAVLMMKS